MRLKIFILSTMLITLISGVLFYKNLTQISVGKTMLKHDIDELRSINLQINNKAFALRKNLNSDLNELQNENARIKELLDLIYDINKNTPELTISVEKIRNHFQQKQEFIEKFEAAVKELRSSVNSLVPTYNELDRNNIKFTLEKRDFYRECLLDAYMYISFSHKDNEMRILEDLKVLGQIINYSKTPDPIIQKFAGHMEVIHKRVKEIDYYLDNFKEDTISSEVKIIVKYYQDSLNEQNEQNENLLTFMFVAIGIYIFFMIFFLRKN